MKNFINQKRIISVLMAMFVVILFGVNTKVSAAINNTISFQTKIIVKSTGLNITAGTPPTCVVAGADTCDFRVRIWNIVSGGTATAGNNLLYEELFNNVELGSTNGIFNLTINSVCAATLSTTHSWSVTVASATICNIFDDNADPDTIVGVNFARADLYLEVTFDPSGAWTTLASPPGGIETFARNPLTSIPSAFSTQTLDGRDADGYVRLSPSSVQNTTSTTSAISVNQQGSGDLISLERTGGGQNALKVNNAGQLSLGSTNGEITLGGDTNLYRTSASANKTDDNFIVQGNSSSLSVVGLSNFFGDLRNVLTPSDGQGTTLGAGVAATQIFISSFSNLNAGNVISIGTAYAVIVSVDPGVTVNSLTVTPAISWSSGKQIYEYTAAKLGGDGTDVSLMFNQIWSGGGLTVGGPTTGRYTTYQNQLITSGSNSFKIVTPNLDINSTTTLSLNTTKGLIINKEEFSNGTPSWSTQTVDGIGPRYASSVVNYNGKAYIYGGQTSAVFDELYAYEYATGAYKFISNGITPRTQHVAVEYNGKMYVWGGYNGVPAINNTIESYEFSTGTWTSLTAGGTARGEPSGVVYKDKMYVWGSSGVVLDAYNFATDTWSTITTTGSAVANGSNIEVYNDKIYQIGGAGQSTKLYSFDFKTNAWTALTDSPLQKTGHSSVIVNNKLYELFGYNDGGTDQNTVGIYDFATDTWSTGTAGGTARRYVNSVAYNGSIYNFFGNGAGASQIVDAYNLAINTNVLTINVAGQEKLSFTQNNVLNISQTLGLKYLANDAAQYSNLAWSTGTAGGTARYHTVSVEYNGKIYNWGGSTTLTITALTNALDIYDIKTATWTTGTSGGTARWGAKGVAYNGKIYIITGCTTTGTGCATTTTIVDIYNISANTWSTGTSGGVSRSLAAVTQSSGKIYAWGGLSASANVNTLSIYDIAADSWSAGTAGGTARRFVQGVIVKNKMYIWGGFAAAVSNVLDIYDIQTGTWQAGTAGGTARRSYAMGAYNDRIYIVHGFTTLQVNTVDVFDISRNVWQSATAGGTARYDMSFATYGNKIYLWGGYSGAAVLNTVDILELGTSKAEDIFYIANNLGSGPDDGKLFRFDATGRAYTSKQGGWFSVGADYAEYMHTEDTSIEAGDIVKLNANDGRSIQKAKLGDAVIGIISTQPGFVGNITNVEDINNNNPNWKLMSMVGQVPVKVIGKVNVGDKVGISNIEGIGTKVDKDNNNIGIAQESHSGDEIGTISVLVTRNNSGINNKIKLSFGEKGEQGFRLNTDGQIQYKDSLDDWKNLSQQIAVDSGVIWKKIGSNIYSNNDGVTSIGVDESQLSSTKLQVGGDIEVKNGLKYSRLSAAANSLILGSAEVGFRLNNNALQFRDLLTNEWKDFSGLQISDVKFNSDNSYTTIGNVEQVTGWGFIKGDGINAIQTKSLSFGKNYSSVPVVIVDIVGSTSSEPEALSSCQFDTSIVTMTPYSIDSSKFNLNVKTEGPMSSEKYYCYSWRAIGN